MDAQQTYACDFGIPVVVVDVQGVPDNLRDPSRIVLTTRPPITVDAPTLSHKEWIQFPDRHIVAAPIIKLDVRLVTDDVADHSGIKPVLLSGPPGQHTIANTCHNPTISDGPA